MIYFFVILILVLVVLIVFLIYQNSKIKERKFGYPKTDLVWFAKLFENELSSILIGIQQL